MAEYRPTAVALSPLPATGQVGGAPASRVIDNRPLRAQYAVISNPGSSASGPFSPKPVTSAYIKRGFQLTTSSYSSFTRLRARGGVLTISTSAHFRSRSTTCWALGDFRSRDRPRLL